MEIQLEDCKITSYQLGVLDADAERADFAQLTTELTANAFPGFAGGVLVASGDVYLKPSSFQITSAGEDEASSRLFVGNLTMNSEDSIPATSGHVAISLGDGNAIEAAGDDYGIGEWSDPAQPDGGTNMSPWTVTHSSNSGNRANPDTFDCSELVQWATTRAGAVPKGDPLGDGDVDGRDFLVWQRGYATDDGLLLPAVQDDGLLLPAVQTGGVSVASGDVNGDNSALGDPVTFTFTVRPDSAAPGPDGTSNTLMIGEVVQTEPWTAIATAESGGETGTHDTTDGEYVLTTIQHASQPKASIPETDDEVLIAFEFGDTANAAESAVRKGGWITDVTFERLETGAHALYQDVVIPAVQTDDGLLLPAVQDDGLLLPAVQTDDAFVFTAIALAESGGNSEPHPPHGEDSLGLFQINVEPNQYDPDAFANDLHDSPTGPAVAMETLTIAHEGYWLI